MRHENWLSSKEKWEKIVKNIRNRNKIVLFDIDEPRLGVRFYDVVVTGKCGYCTEYVGCADCPLDHMVLCGHMGYFRLCSLLRDADYKSALPLAKKILDFIINDEPKETP
jgi:hypothetical protein